MQDRHDRRTTIDSEAHIDDATAHQVLPASATNKGIFNVKDYGAVGDGVTDDSAAVIAAEDAADEDGGILWFPPGTYKLSSNVPVSSNVTVLFVSGAKLSIDAGITFTINGTLAAGEYQIFSGDGTAAFAVSSAPYVLLEWWGGVGDDSTDCHAAFELAVTAALVVGEIFIPSGTYQVSDKVDNFAIDFLAFSRKGITIRGTGGQSVLKYTGTSGFLFELQNDAGTNAQGVNNVKFADLRIEAPNLTDIGGGIEFSHAAVNYVDRVTFVNFGTWLSKTTIAFVDSDPPEITDSGNNFVTAGKVAGQQITVFGSTSNDGHYTIDTVAGDGSSITLVAGDSLTAEAAGDNVRITNRNSRAVSLRGPAKTQTEDSFTHNADRDFTYTDAGVTEKFAIQFTPAISITRNMYQVSVTLTQDGSADGTIHAEIWSDSGGEPDAQIGLDSDVVYNKDITTDANGEIITFTFASMASRADLTNGVDYWIVLATENYTAGTLTLRVQTVGGAGQIFAIFDSTGPSWSTDDDGSNNVVVMRSPSQRNPIWTSLDHIFTQGDGAIGGPAIGVYTESGGTVIINNSTIYAARPLVADGTPQIRLDNTQLSAVVGINALEITGGTSSIDHSYLEGGSLVYDGGIRHTIDGTHIASFIAPTPGTPLVVDKTRKQRWRTSDPAVENRDYQYKLYTATRIMQGYDGTAGDYNNNNFNLSTDLSLVTDEYATAPGNAIEMAAASTSKGFMIFFNIAGDVALSLGTYIITCYARKTTGDTTTLRGLVNFQNEFGENIAQLAQIYTLTTEYLPYKFLLNITREDVDTRDGHRIVIRKNTTAGTVHVSHVELERLGVDTPFGHDIISYSAEESDDDGARASKHLFLAQKLDAETLDQNDFGDHDKWDTTGDFDDTGGNATYTHSGGSGTLTQNSSDFVVAAASFNRYRFQYTVSAASGSPAATITTSFARTAQTLDLTAGTHVLYFSSKSSPSDFVISATSSAAAGFTLDDVSLRKRIEQSALASITASHDGPNIDEKGKLEIALNDGNDGMSPTNAVTIDSRGDVTFAAAVTIGGETVFTPSATQVINAAGDSILANATSVVLDPDGNYTLTSAPTIPDGDQDQLLIIRCANSEANIVTVQDQDTLPGSNLQLHSTTRAITGKQPLLLMFDGDDWIEPAGDGDQGDTGLSGDTGTTGDTGVGDTGADSTVQGDTGSAGDTGAGDQGDTGQDSTVQGDTGSAGDTGIGDQGDTGTTNCSEVLDCLEPPLTIDTGNNRVGINETTPERDLEIRDSSNPQVRLTHTAGVDYTDFQVDGAGDLSIQPSGSNIEIQANLLPDTNLSRSLGSPGLEFDNAYVDDLFVNDDATIGDDLSVGDRLTVGGDFTLNGQVSSDLLSDSTLNDIGSATFPFGDIFLASGKTITIAGNGSVDGGGDLTLQANSGDLTLDASDAVVIGPVGGNISLSSSAAISLISVNDLILIGGANLELSASGGDIVLNTDVDFDYTMGASSKDPTTDAPDDWVEVKIGGNTFFLPAYTAS